MLLACQAGRPTTDLALSLKMLLVQSFLHLRPTLSDSVADPRFYHAPWWYGIDEEDRSTHLVLVSALRGTVGCPVPAPISRARKRCGPPLRRHMLNWLPLLETRSAGLLPQPRGQNVRGSLCISGSPKWLKSCRQVERFQVYPFIFILFLRLRGLRP
jgi:hypothetical protein